MNTEQPATSKPVATEKPLIPIIRAAYERDPIKMLVEIIRSDLTLNEKEDLIHESRNLADLCAGEVDVTFVRLSAHCLSGLVLEDMHFNKKPTKKPAKKSAKQPAVVSAK